MTNTMKWALGIAAVGTAAYFIHKAMKSEKTEGKSNFVGCNGCAMNADGTMSGYKSSERLGCPPGYELMTGSKGNKMCVPVGGTKGDIVSPIKA